MKITRTIIGALFCIGFALGSASLGLGQTESVNYEKVALLKWYAANQSGVSFSLGPHSIPIGLAFDGTNIWVTDGPPSTKKYENMTFLRIKSTVSRFPANQSRGRV